MAENNTQDSLESIQRGQQEAMKNSMHEILPGLWLGGYLAAENVDDLVSKRIKLVLTLKTGEAPDAVRLAYEDKQIENKRFRVEDSSKQDILPVFQECCAKIERNSRTPGAGGVLVHCTMGMSRSASVVIAYLIQRWGIDHAQGLSFIREKRNAVNPNRGFIAQLKKWESNLKAEAAAKQKVQEGLATVLQAVKDPKFKPSSRVAGPSAAGASSSQTTETDSTSEGSAIKVEAGENPVTNPSAVAAVPTFDPALVRNIAAGIAAAVVPTPAVETPTTETVREVFYRWRSKQGPWRAQ